MRTGSYPPDSDEYEKIELLAFLKIVNPFTLGIAIFAGILRDITIDDRLLFDVHPKS